VQQRIVDQAFENRVDDSLLVPLVEQIGTVQFDMNMVKPGRAGDFLGGGAYGSPLHWEMGAFQVVN